MTIKFPSRLKDEDVERFLDSREAVYRGADVPEGRLPEFREYDRQFLLSQECGASLGFDFVGATSHRDHGPVDVVTTIMDLWSEYAENFDAAEAVAPYARRGFVDGFLSAVTATHEREERSAERKRESMKRAAEQAQEAKPAAERDDGLPPMYG